MATAAPLALAAWRHETRTFQIIVRGIDLTGQPMALQVRLAPDTPGAPLLALTEAAGLSLAPITNDNGVPVSTINGTISQAQMEALPYSGEVGDPSTFAFNLQLAGVTRAFGSFAALATVNGADNAPANRPTGYGCATPAAGLWDTATIAIGTDTIELTIDGLPIIQAIAANLASQAQVTTTIGAALAGAVAAVPVNANPNELSAPSVPAPAVNSSFDVLIVVTNTGDTYLTAGGVRLHVTNGGGVAIPAGGLATGTIVTLMYSPGGVFAVTAVRSVNQSPAILASLATVTSITEQMAGAPITYPVGGNVNEIVAPDAAAPAVNATFSVLLTATNTAETYLTVGGVRLRIADGGGTSIAAGGLVKGMVVSLSYSPGGAFVLGSSNPIVAPKSPNGTDDPDLNNRPWGSVTFAADGTRSVGPIIKNIIVPGSSNANPSYVPNAELPALVAAGYLNQFVNIGIVFNGITTAVAGAPMVTIMSQLDACPEFNNGNAMFVIPFYWMNDARTIFYHSQGGVLAQIAGLRAAIPQIRAKGAEPVLVTGFHPDPRAPGVALDPYFFSDTDAFPSGGSTQNMDFPASKLAPVDPNNQMYPPAGGALEAKDWTGSGVIRKGYVRLYHVNRLIRQLAESTGCVLLDIEFAFFRNIIEKLPDLDPGLETYFDSSSSGLGPLHPKAALYDACVSPLLKQWAFAVAQGRTDRRVFTGY